MFVSVADLFNASLCLSLSLSFCLRSVEVELRLAFESSYLKTEVFLGREETMTRFAKGTENH